MYVDIYVYMCVCVFFTCTAYGQGYLKAMSTVFLIVNFLFIFFNVGMYLKVHKKYVTSVVKLQ